MKFAKKSLSQGILTVFNCISWLRFEEIEVILSLIVIEVTELKELRLIDNVSDDFWILPKARWVNFEQLRKALFERFKEGFSKVIDCKLEHPSNSLKEVMLVPNVTSLIWEYGNFDLKLLTV